jgi:outer membrane protein TolC
MMKEFDMKIRRPVVLITALLLLWPVLNAGPTQAAPQAQGKSLSLSLNEAITRALQKNLALQAAIVAPQISEVSVQQAGEKYYPSLSFSYSDQTNKNASYSWLDANTGNVLTLAQNYSSQVTQQLPTGGSFSVTLNGSKTNTNRRGQTINPSYQGQLQFAFTQPLLQGFGPKIANYNILVARNNLDISETSFIKTVQDTVYTVTQAYWSLVYSIENLKVQRLALQLAKDFLVKNQRSVEIGTLSPLDVMSAQAEVASREANIIAAEASVKNAEDQIKMLINLSDEEEKGLRDIVALDQPRLEEQKADLDQALMLAMQNRTDLKISQLGLKNQELGMTYTKNQLLPSLGLTAQYWSPGVSGTQIVYLGNPLDGNILGTVPGTGTQALKDAFNFKYKNWSVRLNLSIPLSNMISRASLAQAKLNMDQALLSLKNQEKQVVLEIRNAVRSLDTTYRQVQAFRLARELAEKKLQAEEERLRVGLSTNYLVLQYQRDLTSSRVSELNAIINYNLAQVALDRSTGVILEKRNIKITDLLNR